MHVVIVQADQFGRSLLGVVTDADERFPAFPKLTETSRRSLGKLQSAISV